MSQRRKERTEKEKYREREKEKLKQINKFYHHGVGERVSPQVREN